MTTCLTITLLALSALSVAAEAVETGGQTTEAAIRHDTCRKPDWPGKSWQRKEHGTVTLSFLVDETGKPRKTHVRKSSGFIELDDAARYALSRCKFNPAMQSGIPIQRWASMQYVWMSDATPPSDPVAAAKALGAAGIQGDMDALYKLSHLLRFGYGIKPNPASANILLVRAAEGGHAEAALVVANQYEFGTPAQEKDLIQARRWHLKAADLGVADAQYRTAEFLLDAPDKGPDDFGTAVTWLRKAADQGQAKATYALAQLLAEGKGITRDQVEALRLLRIAAEKDHAAAQHALGVALIRGAGVAADMGEAVRWLEAASANHESDAELQLAELKLEGKAIPRDEAGGMQLLRRAAEGGNIPAMSILGTLLKRGVLTPPDGPESASWLEKAARYGATEPPYGTGYFRQLMANP